MADNLQYIRLPSDDLMFYFNQKSKVKILSVINLIFETMAWAVILADFKSVAQYVDDLIQVKGTAELALMMVVIYSIFTLAFGLLALTSN